MSTPVIYRRLARAEFDDAVDWYEQQQAGLGDRFADAVHGVIARISANPNLHRVVHKDIRRAIVRGWPYVIYYRIEPNQVVVTSVFHSKRNPKVWQSRK